MFSKAVSVVGSVASTTAPHNTNTTLNCRNNILTYLWSVLPGSPISSQLLQWCVLDILTITDHLSSLTMVMSL